MHSIRRAALRAAARSYSPPVLRSSIPASRHISSCLVRAPTPCSHYISRTPFRQYATDPEKDLHDEEHSSDNASDLAEGIKEKTSSAAESVSNTVGDAIDSVTPDGPASSAQSTPIRSASSSTSSFATDPSKTLYIGNLYFEVTPEALRTEFGRHGEVEDTKVVYDGRGLSKGFGYVTFASESDATAAKEALDMQVFEGRRMAVQYAKASRKDLGGGSSVTRNPPGKTLFIGNMSYEMSDKDLNDLFREIKNVLDVRVAIDRRTGQPRGFAHADFTDVESAEKAAEMLRSKAFYGRSLRIDYSTGKTDNPRPT